LYGKQERFDTIDMKNISLKELKRTLDLMEISFDDTELNQLVFVTDLLTLWADELQNLGSMSLRTKNIEHFDTNDYMFMFLRYRNFRARNYHLKSSNVWVSC
jgi:hypothetical protein